ncbi:hypothetical protein TNCV_424381 [Trichonephila clavipes]|nr:hypothetical protein TNCV_424381 [Trichonephila clavipes]
MQQNKIQQKKSPFYLLFGYEPCLPRELHIGSFIDDTPCEDQLDLFSFSPGKKLQIMYMKHIWRLNTDLIFIVGLIRSRQEITNSPIFKGPFVIVRPVWALCYEIKSRTLQNKFIKVVHVHHLRPYFKRDADVMQNNTSYEENDSSAEDHQEVSVTTEPSPSRNHLRRNHRPPKRF